MRTPATTGGTLAAPPRTVDRDGGREWGITGPAPDIPLTDAVRLFRNPKHADRASPGPAARGEEFAEDALALAEALYSTAWRLTRNAADAQDLVQDTYLKAFRAADRFARGSNLKAWLYTILHNTWRNRRRDAARDTVEVDSVRVDQAVASAAPAITATETPEDLLLRGTIGADLQAALDALPDAFREAVWLRDVEELTYAEMAAVLDVPIGTVMSRISRGRKLLYQHLTAASALAARGTPEARG